MSSQQVDQARRHADSIRNELIAGGRASRRQMIELCERIDQLAMALEAAEQTLERLDLLEETRAQWDTVANVVRDRFGLDVSSRDGVSWSWRWGREEGSSSNLPRAILAGLAVAGAKQAPVLPASSWERQVGGQELPGEDDV